MRDAKKEQEKELSDLFKAVITVPKLAFGEDPKSVICPFFKAGRCDKGDRCKYSHDLSLNTRKSAKKDIHTDTRDEKKQETNADWDRDKLEEVLRQKEGKRPQTTTKIVCRYFLDAIEKECYGWFWQCPNGPESTATLCPRATSTKAVRSARRRLRFARRTARRTRT